MKEEDPIEFARKGATFVKRLHDGEPVRLPTDQESLDDLKLYRVEGMVGKSFFEQKVYFARPAPPEPRFIAFDEYRDIPEGYFERLIHWARRNVLSAEERERIYGDKTGEQTIGFDVASGPDETVISLHDYTGQTLDIVPLNKSTLKMFDDIQLAREEADKLFYGDLFKTMKDDGDANAD